MLNKVPGSMWYTGQRYNCDLQKNQKYFDFNQF